MTDFQIALMLFLLGFVASGSYITGIEIILMNKKLDEILKAVKRLDHDES